MAVRATRTLMLQADELSVDDLIFVSVDDHVVEPPTLWTDRLPAKYADRAPRVVRTRTTALRNGSWSSTPHGAVS